VAKGIEVLSKPPELADAILSEQALRFVGELHRNFEPTRQKLLERRKQRQAEFDRGVLPDFLPETESVRAGDWKAAPTPSDLQQRWVEITGPVDRKMMINAFNSGADVFMADFEDSLSPTWSNVVLGQANLVDAVRRRIDFVSPEGKAYRLNADISTLLVRPRGWHLNEKHVTVDGTPVSGSLFDFGLYMFHNARERLERGTGPYFYLPKMQSHREARLWNEVFLFAQDALGIPRGSIRATVLIETLPAAFEMDEILWELKEHGSGLNAGRWDYLFSLIKTLRSKRDAVLPDRVQVTMIVPFMRAYTELLVQTCHRRGAHAMGGMAPFIPSRRDPQVNEAALAKVRQDKLREAGDGFDGTWVAHPDLVPVAREVFETALSGRANQKERLRPEVSVTASQLVDTRVPGGEISEGGFRTNVNVALQYLNSWLTGNGAAAIFNLMEDVATAEISRSQLWQWIHAGARFSDGRAATPDLYRTIRAEELARLGGPGAGRLNEAAEILNGLVESRDFVEFLTFPAYGYLD
jgi:malate synthase